MIDSRSLGGFIGEKGALKHKCISYEWKKPLSRLAKDHVTMLQAGKQLECLINEQVRLPFWFDLTLLAHMFLAKHRGQYKLLYCTRAIISRSWLEAALEYKPYIRTEFSEKTSLKTKKWSLEMG